MRLCTYGDCMKKHQAKGLCKRHYMQFWSTGSPEIKHPSLWGTPEERFWRQVQKHSEDECWEWLGYRDKNGYGSLNIKSKESGIRAHRFSYQLHIGLIPEGLLVLHKCPGGGNPWCVNPAHLKVGTQKENVQDKIDAGRSRHSEESRRKRSVIFKGRIITPEWRAKIARKNETLVDEQVRYIRELLALGVSQYTIADMFDVHQGTISNIKTGKNYSHIL